MDERRWMDDGSSAVRRLYSTVGAPLQLEHANIKTEPAPTRNPTSRRNQDADKRIDQVFTIQSSMSENAGQLDFLAR